ncbi:MAG: M1 family metallopeptidase [Terriglobia bacterium]
MPHDVIPSHYQMTFEPNFQQNNFTGDETIDVRISRPTKTITLNALEIQFHSATVSVGATTQKAQVATDPKAEMATLAVPDTLAAGPAKVHIKFVGLLTDQLRGFYLAHANHREYAVTQFEPTDARRAFPGFDEPAMKATFAITLIVNKDDTAISNGHIVSDTPGPGPDKHTIKFSTTAKMSSYLVAMLVGDFTCLSGSSDGVPIRVCATPDKVQLGSYALKSAEQILHFYDQYFGIKYAFGKLDLIAIPDFEAGAMENAGAITFRETALLIDDKRASIGAHERVFEVAAHEMAHQWFGDLVTMQWWNNIWLNEGFATWMSTKPAIALHPQWDPKTQEALGTHGALGLDSLESTRSIQAPHAETSAQINQLFDGITYGKTAAVLRMLESYVGSEEFRKGINVYLQEHAYGNATAADFWNAITHVSKKPINEIMPTFVNQPGAPLLTLHAQCEGGADDITLSQRRYFFNRDLFEAGTKELWQIPVCLKSAPGDGHPGAVRCLLLKQKQQTFNLRGCSSWILANADARGYYRSAYSPSMLSKLTVKAETGLTPGERITLLGDVSAMVDVGSVNIGAYLDLAEALRNDHVSAVMEDLTAALQYFGRYLVSSSDQAQYRAWVRQLLQPTAERLGWKPAPNESDDQHTLRASVLETLGYTGRDPQVLAEAYKLAEAYLADPSAVDPTLVNTVINLAALNGDAKLYDEFLARTKTAKSPDGYYRYLFALDDFTHPDLLQRSLQLAISPDVRDQDFTRMMGGVMRNPVGRQMAWDFVKSHWPQVKSKLSTWGGAGIIYDTASFCDAHDRDGVIQFFKDHPIPASDRAFKQTVEAINICINEKSQQQSNLSVWLEKQPGGSQGQ